MGSMYSLAVLCTRSTLCHLAVSAVTVKCCTSASTYPGPAQLNVQAPSLSKGRGVADKMCYSHAGALHSSSRLCRLHLVAPFSCHTAASRMPATQGSDRDPLPQRPYGVLCCGPHHSIRYIEISSPEARCFPHTMPAICLLAGASAGTCGAGTPWVGNGRCPMASQCCRPLLLPPCGTGKYCDANGIGLSGPTNFSGSVSCGNGWRGSGICPGGAGCCDVVGYCGFGSAFCTSPPLAGTGEHKPSLA